MQNENEWLFDAIWELCDHAHAAGLPAVSTKLEEAMDTYLAESQPGYVSPVEFERRKALQYADNIDPFAKVNARWVKRLADQGPNSAERRHPPVKTGFVSTRVCAQKAMQSTG